MDGEHVVRLQLLEAVVLDAGPVLPEDGVVEVLKAVGGVGLEDPATRAELKPPVDAIILQTPPPELVRATAAREVVRERDCADAAEVVLVVILAIDPPGVHDIASPAVAVERHDGRVRQHVHILQDEQHGLREVPLAPTGAHVQELALVEGPVGALLEHQDLGPVALGQLRQEDGVQVPQQTEQLAGAALGEVLPKGHQQGQRGPRRAARRLGPKVRPRRQRRQRLRRPSQDRAM
mmetsp:Transcript_67244/g.135057  ORF Transcript_67244/g.135057 Transcript_67244/m.135057 type:complete len:235 (+) Transcript_67244:282-986(+)